MTKLGARVAAGNRERGRRRSVPLLLAMALSWIAAMPASAQDCAALAADPVQRVTAAGVTVPVDLRHIFCGEATGLTRAGGFHSILGFGQEGAPTAILLATPPDRFPPAGSVHFPDGQAKYSSLFPFHCTYRETLASILYATVAEDRDVSDNGEVVEGASAPAPGAEGFCTRRDGGVFRLRVIVPGGLDGQGRPTGVRTAYPLAATD